MDLIPKNYFMRNVLNKFDTSITILLFFHLFKIAFSDNNLYKKLRYNESNDVNSSYEFNEFIKNNSSDTTTEFVDDVQKIALLDNHTESKKEYKIVNFEFHRIKTPFLISIWIFCASLAKIGFHMYPKLNQEVPESCLLISVGVLIGVILLMMNDVNISPLTPDTFFLYMLPPIILDAGYYMPNRLFFNNLGTILMFAVVGTVFNAITIGISLWFINGANLYGHDVPLLEIFLFSTLISAVDPVAVLAVFEEIHVNEVLYIVVFGESLLNDAVTVVLYNMFEVYNEMGFSNVLYVDLLSGVLSFIIVALGGIFIGVVWGFLTGFVTRFTHQVRVIEPILIFVMAYTAYLNAEMFHMSGILAITFCGITMKNYVEGNISHKSHTTIKYTMKMLSSSSETIIFMLLGVSTVNEHHHWNTAFVICTIFFCTFYRTLGVMIITTLVNRFRLLKLNRVDEFVMSYGGLRGAVAFALALLINPEQVKHRSMFVTTTIAVIYFTVFFQGITIRPLVKILNVKTGEKRKPTMNERIHERFMDHLMAGIEDVLGHHGNHHLRDKFRRFDNTFIRPYLLRNHQGAEPKILETYSKLAMKDALDFMRRNASTIGNISHTESVSGIFRNYTAGNLNTSSSCSQLDASTWNIDLQELDYNPCKKDMTDAKIHHLLAEELCQPTRRHRRLSYSRHAVDERDLSSQVNYRTQMSTRRLVGDQHKRHHRRSKHGNKDGKPNHVSFQRNGSAKHLSDAVEDEDHDQSINLKNCEEEINDDDWEHGITFTVNPSSTEDEYCGSAHNSPFRFLDNPPAVLKLENDGVDNDNNDDDEGGDTTAVADDEKTIFYKRNEIVVTSPTIAEITLPWRRHGRGSNDTFTPPAIVARFPWKQGAEGMQVEGETIKQNEFPLWSTNRDYMVHNSPTSTFLGNLNPPSVKSVIGIFNNQDGRMSSENISDIDRKEGSLMRTLLIPCINISDDSNDINVELQNKSPSNDINVELQNKSPSNINSSVIGTSNAKRGGYLPFKRCSMIDLNATVYTIPEEDHGGAPRSRENRVNKKGRSSSVCIPLYDMPLLYKRKSSSSSSSSDDANFA